MGIGPIFGPTNPSSVARKRSTRRFPEPVGGFLWAKAMLRFKPDLPADGTILCLGAHCDDIEIGCGGTLIELRERQPQLRFVWVVFSGDAARESETRAAAAALLGAGANVTVSVYHFRGSYFPYCGADIKDTF